MCVPHFPSCTRNYRPQHPSSQPFSPSSMWPWWEVNIQCLTDTFSLTAILSSVCPLETKCRKCTFTFLSSIPIGEKLLTWNSSSKQFPGTIPSSPHFTFWSLATICAPEMDVFQFLIPLPIVICCSRTVDLFHVHISSSDSGSRKARHFLSLKIRLHVCIVPS